MSARLLAALVLTAALLVATGTARANRPICVAEELLSRGEAAPSPGATAAPAPSLPFDPPAPICLPGYSDDPRCHPDTPVPGPSGTIRTLLQEVFVLVKVPPLGAASASRFDFPSAAARALPPGHARRLDRPPRSA